MYNKKNSFAKHIDFLCLDIISLCLSFLLAYIFRANRSDFISNSSYLNVLLWMIVPDVLYYILFNPYENVLRRSNVDEVKLSLINAGINFLFTVSIMYVLQISTLYSRLILGFTYVAYTVLSFLFRVIWKSLIQKGVIKINLSSEQTLLVICKQEDAKQLIFNIVNSDFGTHVVKAFYFTDGAGEFVPEEQDVLKKEEVHAYVVDQNIDTVMVAADLNKSEKKLIKALIDEGVEVQVYVDSLFGIEAETEEISNIGMYRTLQLNSYAFSSSQRIYFFFKRIIDIVISLFGCLALGIVYLGIKVAYLLSGDSHKIMYKQKRVGLNGRLFDLYKFRSMVPDAEKVLKELLKDEKLKEEWDRNQKLDDDPRITKVGKFIRKTSLDELPQFINVLKGDMSIIGPRPLVPGELASKNGIKLYEKVKPGITGWWACNGRSNMSYEERLEHEYYYVRNCSLYLDLLCVFRTVYIVLSGKGAK